MLPVVFKGAEHGSHPAARVVDTGALGEPRVWNKLGFADGQDGHKYFPPVWMKKSLGSWPNDYVAPSVTVEPATSGMCAKILGSTI